ncbi:MAG: hypothetical protein GF383_03680 [Candidatus Lokiarchaeota archaeon]|nr:hypothetical protein [Candidatus Lokiarchaeota archaeon]MBD3338795.1 hypothetical protein [Candidatus Lokiarchaeota archaeon]
MIRKRFHQHWVFQAPEAILTCNILNCNKNQYLVFGGHDKSLYLMDFDLMILDDLEFDGWVRCSYPADLNGDDCDELLVGTGDGRCLVVKLDPKTQKLSGLMNYKAEGKISCCVAGDFYRDGNLELIFGGEDKTLKIFKNIKSKKPLLTFYYDSWVTCCDLGYMKLPKTSKPQHCLVVGTKNGSLQMIRILDGLPDIVWQTQVYGQINDVKIADVSKDGYNEIIIASSDQYIKVYNSLGKRLKFIKIEKMKPKVRLNRPKTLLVEDIDGDKAKEIVVGCADGSIRVYDCDELNSLDYTLKWSTRFSASIKSICSYINREEKLRHLIFGGYERTMRNITDFETGQKKILKIPVRFNIRQIPVKKEKEEEVEAVPTNLRGYIINLLEKKGFYLTIDLLTKELLKEGYSKDQIEEEIEQMKTERTMQYGKVDIHAWTYNSEEIEEAIDQEIIKIVEDPEDFLPEEDIIVDDEASKDENIGGEVSEKNDAEDEHKSDEDRDDSSDDLAEDEDDDSVEDLVEDEDEHETKSQLDYAPKDDDKIEEKTTSVEEKKLDPYNETQSDENINLNERKKQDAVSKSTKTSSSRNQKENRRDTSEGSRDGAYNGRNKLEKILIEHLKDKKLVSSKSKFINSILSLHDYNEEKIEKTIDLLKENNVIKYSRSKPSGWSLVN